MLFNCMKFCQNILSAYQVIEQTQLCDGQTYFGQIDRGQGTNNVSPDPEGGGDIKTIK